MKNLKFLFFLIAVISSVESFGQKTCTSNPGTIGSNINFGSIVWTASGGATQAECNDMADGLITFTGNVIVDVANSRKITITNDVEIIGDFPISGGPGSALSVNGGFTLHVTGDLGDAANNGVQYEVVTASDEIIVDGTLYGKNNNAFSGNGSISGGTLDVKNGSTCGTPCPVSGGFQNCNSGDSFCTTNNVLPITLLSFDAKRLNESVLLTWTTLMEVDFDKFIVERSSDGLFYSAIGEIPGAGKNIYDIETRYSFEDRHPISGFNYYRLKAVDLDRRYDYSRVLALRIEAGKKFWVHPNPASGSIYFFTNFMPSESDRIVLFNQLGKPVMEVAANKYQGNIDISEDISPGIYILKYASGNNQFSTRVMVK